MTTRKTIIEADDDRDRERIIIAGSRSITNYQILRKVLIADWAPPELAQPNYEIVSGGADGVDELGEQFARKWGIPLTRFVPDWEGTTPTKAAGPIRNKAMAEYADTLISLWDGESAGTRSMIDIALNKGLDVHVYQRPPTEDA